MKANKYPLLFVFLLLTCFGSPFSRQATEGPQKWESAIQEFEKTDREHSPVENPILFLGSSSIRLWPVEESFPDLPVLNRGFGGSTIADSIHFFDRIVKPYRPRAIVFYAGDNDIGKGKTAQEVLEDYKTFARRVIDEMAPADLVYIAIKPSLKRWNLVEEMRKANRSIQAFSQTHPRLHFLDIDAAMLGRDGRPRSELFKEDGLHLNSKGYEIWNRLLGELLVPLLKTKRNSP